MNNLGMARPDMFRAGMCPPDFKPPSETQPPAPANPKKRRKTANNNSVAIQPTPPPTPADLLPPPLTGYGDTIVASNPFDDAPPSSMSMGHFGMNHHQMNPHLMGHPPAMRGMNPMMNPMPGMPGHHMNNRGLSPMNNINPNLSPMGLGMNQIGPMQPNSPNALISGPQMRPPMHSPLANGPGNPNNRINGGQMNPSQHSPHPQMGNLNSPNNSTGPAQNNINTLPGNNVSNAMPVSSSGGPTATSQMNMMAQVNSGPNQGGMYGGPKPMPVSAGKVYPSDCPMVFNPANPNAPPIYPCGICHKEVHDNDQGLLCESGCNFWFHRACSGLNELAFSLIHSEVYAEWCCDKCLQSKNIPMVKIKS